MRRSVFPLTILVALNMTPSVPTRDPDYVRILSWNIHHGEGTDGQLEH